MAITRQNGTVEFEGAVLTGAEWDYSRFLCSDYGIGKYATVWTGVRVERVMVGSDLGGCDTVVVDASPEVQALAQAWREMVAEAARLREIERVREIEAARIDKGKAVIVVRGRKVAKGTKGVVAWIGQNAYGTSVGLIVEGVEGLTFTSISNVERDHSPEALAREIEEAHASALWFEQNHYSPKAAAAKALAAAGVQKGDKVTPKSGTYAGRVCRVIWTGTRAGEARVGVVPAVKGRFDADWLPVGAVA